MHGLRQTVILAIVSQIGSIAAIQYFEFRVLFKCLNMLLGILLTLFLYQLDCCLEGN